MSRHSIGLEPGLAAYLVAHGVREMPLLARLRAETEALGEAARMQIAPEQGAFLGLLVEVMQARRVLEIGTFTGYSALAMAIAQPEDGSIDCCDISAEYTAIARRYWTEAGLEARIRLHLAPAVETLELLKKDGKAGTYDLIFIDADKGGYARYWSLALELARPGGLIAVDNVLWGGAVVDPTDRERDTMALRAFNALVKDDARVTLAMVPIGDGLTLARRRL